MGRTLAAATTKDHSDRSQSARGAPYAVRVAATISYNALQSDSVANRQVSAINIRYGARCSKAAVAPGDADIVADLTRATGTRDTHGACPLRQRRDEPWHSGYLSGQLKQANLLLSAP